MTAIRRVQPKELSLLPEIEISAATLFRDAGIEVFADEAHDGPADFTTPQAWQAVLARGGLIWVAEGASGELLAFLAAEQVEGRLHVLEIDVRRDAQGQGIGRRLMETAAEEARLRGLSGLSLTTFRDVPWNAAFYASLGFRIVETPEGSLAAFLAREATRGLDPERRCAMILDLQRAGAA